MCGGMADLEMKQLIDEQVAGSDAMVKCSLMDLGSGEQCQAGKWRAGTQQSRAGVQENRARLGN